MVVPPDAFVRRGTVNHRVFDAGGEQGLFDQLCQVVVAEPGAQHAAVQGFGEGGTDADADRLDAIAVEVELRHVFTEGFGQAVVAVRAAQHRGVERFGLFVKADHMVRAGEHHPFHAMAARGFIDVKDAFDVGFEDFLERALYRHAAQVHDGVAAGQQGVHSLLVRQVAGRHFLMRAFGFAQCRNVGHPQHFGVGHETLAQHLAQATSGTGQEQALQTGGRRIGRVRDRHWAANG